MEYVGMMRIMQAGLNLILILMFIRSAHDLARIPLLMFASGMTVNVLYLFVLYRYFASLKIDHFIPKEWANYYSGAFPLGVSAILIQVYYNLDTIMLGFMSTQEKVGLYNAAYKIFLAILFILGLWHSTVFPVISQKLDKDRLQAAAFLGKYFRLTILACVPVSFIATLVAPAIIMLVFGGRYEGATIALQILIWNLIPIAISGTYGTLILIPLGLTKEVLWAVGCGALLNVILNFMLIPAYGFVGASFATLMTEIAVAVVTYFMAIRVLKVEFIGHTLKALFGSMISCAAAVLILFLFPGMGFFIKHIISGSLFLFVYLIFLVLAGDGPFLMEFAREILSARKG
jgi:O-antigen/teichoic acid export membrane protein